jgi:hypothetical protein
MAEAHECPGEKQLLAIAISFIALVHSVVAVAVCNGRKGAKS